MTTATSSKLWELVRGRPEVDPRQLAEAIEAEVAGGPLDYRTRLLIRDSVAALRQHWGEEQLRHWLETRPTRTAIEAICREEFTVPGFSSLAERIVERTAPEDVKQFLRELGTQLHRPARVSIGGSVALLLPGHVVRSTEDIDIVDEVPEELRSLYALLDRLRQRYGLRLAHFQSHYLPAGWEQRLHSLGSFGQLQVYLVDVHDVFLSKLFSAREKDRDDLRLLAPQLSKDELVQRLRTTTTALLAEESLRQQAAANWYILYGEPLPS